MSFLSLTLDLLQVPLFSRKNKKCTDPSSADTMLSWNTIYYLDRKSWNHQIFATSRAQFRRNFKIILQSWQHCQSVTRCHKKDCPFAHRKKAAVLPMPYNFRKVIIQDISGNVDFWRSSENDNMLVYIHRNSFLELTVTNTNAFWYLDDMSLILIADVRNSSPLLLHIFFYCVFDL